MEGHQFTLADLVAGQVVRLVGDWNDHPKYGKRFEATQERGFLREMWPTITRAALYILSPRRVVEALIRAFELPQERFAGFRGLTLPGLRASVAEMIEALRAVAGEWAVALIRFERDPVIEGIVAVWPSRIEAQRARTLGFRADDSLEAIVRAHVEDELGGRTG